MSQKINKYSTRHDLPFEHYFSEFNVSDESVIDLGIGTPGKELLASCCEHFKLATNHRMVSFMTKKTNFVVKYLIFILIKQI